MADRHFNELTPAEAERLALLAEEMGEAIQVIGKILRHGYDSRHPDGGPNNRGLLESELGDVGAAVDLMVEAKDVDREFIDYETGRKRRRVHTYLHHQT